MSAGAITSANRIGVTSGTASSRGVRAVSWKRRCASVSSDASGLPSVVGSGRTSSGVAAVIWVLLSPLGGAECAAGEAQVDVVERRLTRAD